MPGKGEGSAGRFASSLMQMPKFQSGGEPAYLVLKIANYYYEKDEQKRLKRLPSGMAVIREQMAGTRGSIIHSISLQI